MSKKNIGTIKGLFLCITLMVFSVGTLMGCRGSKVDFTIALQYWEPAGGGIREGRKLIACMYDWNDFISPSISASLTEKFENLNQRYDKQFFDNNALVVFTFGFPTSGIRFNEVRLNRSDDELILEIRVRVGLAEANSFGIIILEISNENISENTTLSTNIIRDDILA